ncbi:PAAR domain-containing protein [Kosakonia oryzae]|uniref:DUF3289 family protein n=1 Tax=Kosakonia oryzae TaxID=497725 RepID=A0AA94KNG7_9ENTR|nr:PAAR domain-containing protein [Kosakonia oryzae]ANI85323.2 DUF3289 family protein [Kosakonia oryzae]SFB73610.1 conserved hypothetical protein [Kosakonia oryzae]
MWRDVIDGMGQGHHGDKTTTGATCYSSLQGTFWYGAPAPLRKGDRTSVCPACGKNGLIGEGSMRRQFATVPVALDGAIILCGCPYGTNRLIAPLATWFGPEKQPPYIPLADSMPTAEPEQFAQSAKSARPEPLPLPALIYQTSRQMDDDQASDMRHGDLDIVTLRNRFHIDVDNVSMRVNPYTLKQKDPHDPLAFASPYVHPDFQPKPMPSVSRDESARILFDEFRELAKLFSFHGEYQHLITEMIAHMQQNSGKPWRSPLLDKALKEQIEGDRSENSSLLTIKDILNKGIDYDYSIYPLKDKGKFNKDINEKTILPKFNRLKDRFNGLVISVHDTWATHITLESLEIEGDLWRANIHYRVQDHFGLDDADVLNPLYREFRIFPLWFVLQRWNEYGFRPFITEMNATVTISGRRNG